MTLSNDKSYRRFQNDSGNAELVTHKIFPGVELCYASIHMNALKLNSHPHGMMSTYLDLPEWRLTMPSFCIPVVVLTLAFLTLISFLSTRKMLGGTASEALRPYTPKISRKTKLEETRAWNALPFSVKWNLRDIMRHKVRSLMTLLGVFGCMLLIVGALGMNDTMKGFLDMLGEDTADYRTRVDISQSADQSEALALAEEL